MLSYGSKVLLRSTELTSDDWFRLAESRLLRIGSYLEKMVLPVLGKRNWMAHTGTLASQKPEVRGDKAFSLETHGIFPREAIRNGEYGRDGKKIGWGITQNGEVLLITIDFIARSLEGQPVDIGGGKVVPCGPGIFAERPVVVEITNAEKLMGLFHPFGGKVYREIWHTIGSFVRDWTSAREKRFDEAKRLNDELQLEEQLYYELVRNLEKK